MKSQISLMHYDYFFNSMCIKNRIVCLDLCKSISCLFIFIFKKPALYCIKTWNIHLHIDNTLKRQANFSN